MNVLFSARGQKKNSAAKEVLQECEYCNDGGGEDVCVSGSANEDRKVLVQGNEVEVDGENVGGRVEREGGDGLPVEGDGRH